MLARINGLLGRSEGSWQGRIEQWLSRQYKPRFLGLPCRFNVDVSKMGHGPPAEGFLQKLLPY